MHWLRPRSSRAFVLGICMAVGGARSAVDGKGIWTAFGIFGVGVLGVVLTIAWIVTYTREH
ncbi:hypothetical protein ACFWOJ_03990 [Streptomyces sp. NPDC058439]|uniref:hypothetical protein n=1 Tax=Streptomyces sp. NPDC058439 TaxID=3346500 RepID=UPI00364E91CC